MVYLGFLLDGKLHTITALAERAMSYIPAKHTLEEQAYTQTHDEVLEATKVSA